LTARVFHSQIKEQFLRLQIMRKTATIWHPSRSSFGVRDLEARTNPALAFDRRPSTFDLRLSTFDFRHSGSAGLGGGAESKRGRLMLLNHPEFFTPRD
jgi:hypothetical protein